MKKQAAALFEKFRSLTPAGKVRLVLALIGVALLVYLLLAKKPWEAGKAKTWKISQYAAYYLWIGFFADLIVVGFLAATAQWWAAPIPESEFGDRSSEFENRKSKIENPKWFWPLVAAAMALNALLCLPRLGQSFWHDETYPIRNAIVGTYKTQSDGRLVLKPVSWDETFFFYKKPNHTFYSGIARALNEVWRAIARPKGLQFNEVVIRLPAYLAGIASVATVALLLNYLGFSSAGVLAAFLTVLHPWHIRYASEARAYAFVLLLIPLVVYFFLRALESGRWKWWAAFGGSQFLLLYSYPTCVYTLVVLNICAMPALWWRWGKTPGALTQWLRWLITNVGAALLSSRSCCPACRSSSNM